MAAVMHRMERSRAAGVTLRFECPICGHVVLFTPAITDRNPVEVLVRGDESVQHTGSNGPVVMGEVTVSPL